jgi:DNA repair protein RadA/Sms
VLYASAEESAAQVRVRAERLGATTDHVWIAADVDVDALIGSAQELAPSLVVVDSVQALRCADVPSVAGSVTQVRESAARWIGFAKASRTPVVLVGHVTKDGAIAGPRALEHAVDAVLQFDGERHHAHRLLRAQKNRFGRAHELGVFRMGDAGLEQVPDAGDLFLGQRTAGVAGSVVLATVEGTRPLLVEIQALVGEPSAGSPRRAALGVDAGRVAMVLAVLERRAGLRLADRDVFVNVAGGLEVDEPAADLAVAVAIASGLEGFPIALDCFVVGEIGLTGEVRAVSRLDARVREAARLGFGRGIVPPGAPPAPLRIEAVRTIEQALSCLPRQMG